MFVFNNEYNNNNVFNNDFNNNSGLEVSLLEYGVGNLAHSKVKFCYT